MPISKDHSRQTQTAAAEQARVEALHGFSILDTPPEVEFDRLTDLTASIFGVPVAVISLADVERQWFKSSFGLDLNEIRRSLSFCDHTLRNGATLVVPDAREDPRFADNLLVRGDLALCFYAGSLLVAPDGHYLGTLCIADTQPRPDFGEKEVAQLEALAAIVMRELLLRRETKERNAIQAALMESEQQFRGAFETAPVGMALVSLEGRFIQANRSLCDFLGYSEAELLELDFQRITHAADINADMSNVDRLMAGEIPYYSMEKRYVRKDGTPVWAQLNVALMRDAQGNPRHFVSQVKDIQQSRSAQEQLADLVRRHQLAVEAGGIGIWNGRSPRASISGTIRSSGISACRHGRDRCRWMRLTTSSTPTTLKRRWPSSKPRWRPAMATAMSIA